MKTSTRVRLGALVAATAVAAGGLLASAPANAAAATITVAQTTYTAGDWGTGIDIAGTGFSADAVVTVSLAQKPVTTTANGHRTGALPPADTHQVTADGTGAFTETYVPPFVPIGGTITVSATSDQGDTSNSVTLSIVAPKGIAAESSTVTTAELMDENAGVTIGAAGYQPGETVDASVDYDGETFKLGPYTAAEDGSVLFGFYLAAGDAVAGKVTITVSGATSKVTQTVDIDVTGPTIKRNADPAPPKVNTTTSTAASTPSVKKSLPVVSG